MRMFGHQCRSTRNFSRQQSVSQISANSASYDFCQDRGPSLDFWIQTFFSITSCY